MKGKTNIRDEIDDHEILTDKIALDDIDDKGLIKAEK